MVTDRDPVAAPTGTVMIIDVAERTLNSAPVPPICAVVTPPRLVPVTVMSVPTLPDAGVKLVMVGVTVAAPIVKLAVLVPVPPLVVTVSGPVVAPGGTAVTMDVLESTVKVVAGIPLNFTAVAPIKLLPAMVTVAPTPPVVGVKLVTLGTAGVAPTVKLALLVTAPP